MRNRALLFGAIGITLLAALLLSQIPITPAVLAKGGPPAKITWSTRPLTATVTPGTLFTTTVTFTSTVNLNNVHLRLTPSLRSSTTVTPTDFATITAGVPNTVEIDVLVPAGSHRQSFNGTLTLRNGKRAYAMPLPLQFTVQQP